MNSARTIFRNIAIFIVFVIPLTSLAAPLYQPGETLNPACLPTDADCTVATTTSSTSFATTSSDYWLTQQFSLSNLVNIGSSTGTTFLNGNVGIGTSTSGAYNLLLARATGSATANIQTSDAAGEAAINLENSVRRWKIKATAAASDAFVIRDQTAAADRFVINNVGNVGIGTTSAYAKLSVGSTDTASTTFALRPIASQTANILDVYNTSGTLTSVITAAGNWGIGTSAPAVRLQIGSGYANFDNSYGLTFANAGATDRDIARILYSPSGTLDFYNADAVRMTIGYGGNVGIGTSTPSTKLSVEDSVAPALVLSNTDTNIGSGGVGETIGQLDFWTKDGSYSAGGIAGRLDVTDENLGSAAAMRFFTTAQGTFSEKMRISSAGNVGIATTTPYAKLSVTNTGTGPSFVVEDSSSADGTPFVIDASGLVGIGTVPATLGKLEVSDSATTNSYGVSVIKTQSNTVAYQSGIGSTFTSNQTSGAFSGINSAISGQMFIGGSNTQNWTGAQTAEGAGGAAAIVGHVEGRSGWSGTVSNAASFLASNEFSSTGGGVVTNLSGFRVMDSIGTLAPVNQYGVYINALTKGSTSDYGLYFGGAQDSGSIGSAASTHISLMPGTSANVGIGTSSPAAKLHVAMDTGTAPAIASDTGLIVSNLSATGDSAALSLIAGATGYSTLNFGDTADENVGYIQYGHTNNYMALGANTNEYMRITTSGNIGIGTTTPNQLLQIASPDAQFILTDIDATTNGKHATIRSSAGRMAFGFRNDALSSLTEALSIMSTDLVGIGTTSPSSKLSLTQSANTSAGGLWIAETGNTDFRSIYMATDGTMSFYGGDTSGALNTATLNSSGAWTNASDKSYKENIVDLGTKYGLDAVLASTPRFYEMKGNHVPQVGFIAQELEKVIPEVVDGKDGSMGISYGNLVAVAFQAIKELNAKFENMMKALFVNELEVKNKLKVDGEVCVDDVCVTKEQFKKMLEKAGGEEKPKENNKPKEETPKPQENATTTATSTATTTPEVIKEEPKEEPKEEVKPQETASTTPETVVEEPKVEEEKPVVEVPKVEEPKPEEPPKEEVKEEIKPVEEPKKEEPKVEEEKKEEPKSEEAPQS